MKTYNYRDIDVVNTDEFRRKLPSKKKEPQKVIESTDYVFTESLLRAEIIKGQKEMFWFENKVKTKIK